MEWGLGFAPVIVDGDDNGDDDCDDDDDDNEGVPKPAPILPLNAVGFDVCLFIMLILLRPTDAFRLDL